jgi:hypothetical protein
MAAQVKGSAFQSVQADVRRLVDAGRIDLEELGLSEKEHGALDSFVTPVSWVPVATYGRFLDLLALVEGGTNPVGYLRRRGREAARRLLTGAYQGFAKKGAALDLRGLQTVIGAARMIYDFGHWEASESEGGALEILVKDAAVMPDCALHTAEGFLEHFGEATAGRMPRIESRRLPNGDIHIRVVP